MKFRSLFFCFSLVLFAIPSALFAQESVDPVLVVRDPEGFRAGSFTESPAGRIEMMPGEERTVHFTWRNRGNKSWTDVYAFTMEPRYRNSVFAHDSWSQSFRSQKVLTVEGTAVAPGETGVLELVLRAPDELGTYREQFHLAQFNYSWMKYGQFWVDVEVVPAAEGENEVVPEEETQEAVVSEEESVQTEENAAGENEETNEEAVTPPAQAEADEEETVEPEVVSSTYQARMFVRSRRSISGPGGKDYFLSLIYRQESEEAWEGSYRFIARTQAEGVSTTVPVAHETWVDEQVINMVDIDGAITPGTQIKQKFFLRLPPERGSYTMVVDMEVNGEIVPSARFSLPLTVTRDAPEDFIPAFYEEPVEDLFTPRLAEEPQIRVGIWRLEEQKKYVIFEPRDVAYEIYDGDRRIGEIAAGVSATISEPRVGRYRMIISEPREVLYAEDYLRLVPVADPHAVFELKNYEREYGGRVYKTYRGAMEYRRNMDESALYVINELLFSDYVKGIGENANKSNFEYLKAQSVAQRTYAYAIQQQGTKHRSRYFDVVAHTGDQLYLGHLSEVAARPRFAAAAEATRGYMVTYDTDNDAQTPNEVVVTPYFARTDGRTRAWTEVWGGRQRPWLVSVPAEYDRRLGYGMFGHGVGMSQIDAVYRAEEEGLDWEQLIKYYYTGVEVERMFE